MLSTFLKEQIFHIYNKTVDVPQDNLYSFIDKLPKIKPTHYRNHQKIKFIQSNITKDDIVLDYGCGNARVLAELKNECICIERPEMFNYEEHKNKPQIKFIYEKDPSKLPKLHFTTITFFHALHHIENLREVLEYVVKTPSFKQMLVLDHNCTNASAEEVLKLQHYLYRHAYNETYYYTEFYSRFNMRNLLSSMGLEEFYHHDLKRYDYSYYAKYRRKLSANTLLPYFEGLAMTTEGVYSHTKAEDFNPEVFGKSNKIIVDCTANIGGDVLQLVKIYNEVIAFEEDPINFSALQVNTKNLSNVTIHQGNCIKLLDKYLKPGVDLYFDPPWGGPDYKREKTVITYIYGYTMDQLIDKYKTYRIVFKLPKNHKRFEHSVQIIHNTRFIYVVYEP